MINTESSIRIDYFNIEGTPGGQPGLVHGFLDAPGRMRSAGSLRSVHLSVEESETDGLLSL